MGYYIKIKNGLPDGHPISEENFVQAFPEIDTLNLPDNFSVFFRVSQPDDIDMPVGAFQVAVCSYVLNEKDNSWQDKWSTRDMTDEEKSEKISTIKSFKPFDSWVFNESIPAWEAPVPMPDGGMCSWDENSKSWKQTFIKPEKIDFSNVSFK